MLHAKRNKLPWSLAMLSCSRVLVYCHHYLLASDLVQILLYEKQECDAPQLCQVRVLVQAHASILEHFKSDLSYAGLVILANQLSTAGSQY